MRTEYLNIFYISLRILLSDPKQISVERPLSKLEKLYRSKYFFEEGLDDFLMHQIRTKLERYAALRQWKAQSFSSTLLFQKDTRVSDNRISSPKISPGRYRGTFFPHYLLRAVRH